MWRGLVVAVAMVAGCGGEDSPDVSELQRTILADGLVTRSEYERALESAATCLRDEGWDVAFGRAAEGVAVPIDVDLGPDPLTDSELMDADRRFEQCLVSEVSLVEEGYLFGVNRCAACREYVD